MGMDSLEFAMLFLGLALVLYFLTLLLFLCFEMLMYILYHCMWKYVTCFFHFDFMGITVKRLPWFSYENLNFGLLNNFETVIDFWVYFYIIIWLQDYEGQAVGCGGLNRNSPDRLIYLNDWLLGSVANWQWLGGVALLEWICSSGEVCRGWALGFQILKPGLVSLSCHLQIWTYNSQLLQYHVYLCATMLPGHTNNALTRQQRLTNRNHNARNEILPLELWDN